MSMFAALDKKRVVTALVTLLIAFLTGHLMQTVLADKTPVAAVDDAPDAAPVLRSIEEPKPLPTPPAATLVPILGTPPVLPDRVKERRGQRRDASAPSACKPGAVASAAPGATIVVRVQTCQAQARVTLRQGDITVDQTSDKEGRAEIRIPAFRERVELDVTHPGGTETLGVTVTDATNYEHVALQWTGPQVLKMHAYEFGARRNQFGHVWSGAPKSPIRAARGSGGFLTGLGDGSGASAEIYSFPAGETPVRGVVRLIVEAEVTESTCDSDVRATAHQTGALSRMTATEVEFKMPGCDTVGDIVQLQNLLRDMRLAGR